MIWEDLVDAKTIELTANDNTVYNFIWLDSHKGPLVVVVPPKVLGAINDFWYRWVADVGITGASAGTCFEVSPGVTNLDGYIQYYYFATGVTPAMENGW